MAAAGELDRPHRVIGAEQFRLDPVNVSFPPRIIIIAQNKKAVAAGFCLDGDTIALVFDDARKLEI